jgi:hypothetical protein
VSSEIRVVPRIIMGHPTSPRKKIISYLERMNPLETRGFIFGSISLLSAVATTSIVFLFDYEALFVNHLPPVALMNSSPGFVVELKRARSRWLLAFTSTWAPKNLLEWSKMLIWLVNSALGVEPFTVYESVN